MRHIYYFHLHTHTHFRPLKMDNICVSYTGTDGIHRLAYACIYIYIYIHAQLTC